MFDNYASIFYKLNYNRLIDYLRFCRQKQLEFCQENLDKIVESSVQRLSIEERESLDQLIECSTCANFAITCNSHSTLELLANFFVEAETSYCLEGLIKFIELKRGPLSLSDPKLLDPNEGRRNFEILFLETIGTLCASVEKNIEEALFVVRLAERFVDLANGKYNAKTSEWLSKVRFCLEVDQIRVRRATFEQLLKRIASVRRFFVPFGRRNR